MPSAPYTIEPAAAADVPALVELLGMLFSLERELSPNPDHQRRGLERILANPAVGQIFVVRVGSGEARRVAGTASLLFSESTFLGGPVAWLEDVVIRPEFQRTGLGAALLAEIERFALGKGLLRIQLLTDFDNASAMRLYERAGFARSTMVPMRRMLADD